MIYVRPLILIFVSDVFLDGSPALSTVSILSEIGLSGNSNQMFNSPVGRQTGSKGRSLLKPGGRGSLRGIISEVIFTAN